MEPIRILHVVTYMGRGGLETMIMNYYRHIDREKVQFDFLVHRGFEADYDAEILSLGGRIYRVPTLNPFSLKYQKALDEFFSKHHYDIVHSHLDCMSAYPLRVAKKYGVKVRIAHAHNKNQDFNLKYLIKILSKLLMPIYATNLFACSEEAGEWMFSGKMFTIMNNAIDAKKYIFNQNIQKQERNNWKLDDSFVVGHIGRFNPQKNHSFLIDIFAEVVKLDSKSKLFLIGTGEGEAAIREKVVNMGLAEKVIFAGNRDDVPSLLQTMDVFVFPSLYEGLGIAAVEAQAAGVPCVLSDQVPIECKMIDEVEFISLKDTPEVWAKHILAHKKSIRYNKYEKICSAGYDIDDNIDWLEKFYLSGGTMNER